MRILINKFKILKTKTTNETKAWFINIDNFIKEENSNILYLSFKNLNKVINSGQFDKIPDPVSFMSGVTYQIPIEPYEKVEINKADFENRPKFSFSKFKHSFGSHKKKYYYQGCKISAKTKVKFI